MGKTKLNAVTQALVHIDPDKHPLFIRLKKSGDFVWLARRGLVYFARYRQRACHASGHSPTAGRRGLLLR